MTFVSYAQNFEDVLLWRALRHVERGFYIDVGAAHPDTDSVTRAFYDRGWTGINVEPVPELHGRLAAARPRDVNVGAVLGDTDSVRTIYVVPGTGLSTTQAELAELHGASGYDVQPHEVRQATLARLCDEHAPETIHFLKIDVEGAEKAVLAGAAFSRHRPWIIVVEATAPGTTLEVHHEWEPILLAAGYSFVWFDGLNRFYLAAEQHPTLAQHFLTPPGVFDDFIRAADSEWARRIAQAETRAADLEEWRTAADARAAAADARARDAERRTRDVERRAHDAETRAQAAEMRAQVMDARAQAAERRLEVSESQLLQAEEHAGRHQSEVQRLSTALQAMRSDMAALRASGSWQFSGPLFGGVTAAGKLFRRKPATLRPAEPATQKALPRRPAAMPLTLPAPARTARILPSIADGPPGTANDHVRRREVPRAVPPATMTVHQFHSGSAEGDAITNAMFLIQARLRAAGYRSDIFVEHLDPALQGRLRPLDEMPITDSYVLILHLSMGFDAYDRVAALPARKVLIYHNITPPAFLEGQPDLQRYARLGRQQLAKLRGQVAVALADSDYNVLEMASLGFDRPQTCTLLFDLDALRLAATPGGAAPQDRPFTLLFVGRIIASKAQLDLVEAYARFRDIDARPSRLVLVGRADGVGEEYAQLLHERSRALGVDPFVHITGFVSEDVLRDWYRHADLYVSLSHHEGFGVPLVEAAAAGVPTLAWPAGAVGYTVAVSEGLLKTREADQVGLRIAELAGDPEKRRMLTRAQQDALCRFALPAQWDVFTRALATAGAAPPPAPSIAESFRSRLRFTIAGHINGSYSLAAINRTLALSLSQARPGCVRLEAVEGSPVDRASDVPEQDRAAIGALMSRPPHPTGPVVVISQHYPLFVPAEKGDALLAYFFWEETVVPAETVCSLNQSFTAVLAPSRFVAKALRDSGVALPIHVVGFAPDLRLFEALARDRASARERTCFLHVSSGFPRKGVDVLLAAYSDAFTADDPVRLVIKTFPNPHNDVRAQIARLAETHAALAPIELIDEDLDPQDMQRLFDAADVMVLPTRGEGFNIPAAEAMAAGIPLIVTGAGGHMDFCREDNARLVDFKWAPSQSHLAGALSLWAEPNTADLSAALRQAHDDPQPAMARAAAARPHIGDALSSAAFVQRVEAASLRTLLRPASGRTRLCVVSSWNVRCGVADYTGALVGAMAGARQDLDIVILADERPEDADGSHSFTAEQNVRVRQAWTLGSRHIAHDISRAASIEDAQIVLLQHQPALLPWDILAETLDALARIACAAVVTLHNTASLLDLEDAERAIVLKSLGEAARVIVHTVRDIERLRGLGLSENLALLPHGAPTALLPAAERTLIDRDTVIIGCCGFLLPGKGIPALVEAVALLKPRWPRLRLRLMNASYGSESSLQEAARVGRAIADARLEQDVELATDFLPYSETLWRLAECDLIVLPYPFSQEGSSAALRMALASGRCVAVTPIGLFEDAGDAAERLPATSVPDIARGIDRLLLDRNARTAARDRSRVWLAERSWEIIGARLGGMLVGLAGEGV